jgi:hypothetical protein
VHLGIEAVQAALKVQADGKPRLFIFKTDSNTIREMAGLKWSESPESKDAKDEPPEHVSRYCCESIYSGVAWLGKRPGFAVVVGTSGIQRFGSNDVYPLDEFELVDTRELVRRAFAVR